MIYISSACVKSNTIKEAVEELVSHGFRHIELSGGTNYYEGLVADLLEVQAIYDLKFICHNYFPPPSVPFILNLASLDKEINQKSLDHIKKSINLSRCLGATRFAFHAGFILDFSLAEIGKRIKKRKLYNRQKAEQIFIKNLQIIDNYAAKKQIDVYVENNVLSQVNKSTYFPDNPFFFTNTEDYQLISKVSNLSPLLDIAHLKVSTHSLGLDFETELNKLLPLTDYLHVSDNDGLEDSNLGVSKNSSLYRQLKKLDLSNKIITIEVYEGMDKIKETAHNIADLQAR